MIRSRLRLVLAAGTVLAACTAGGVGEVADGAEDLTAPTPTIAPTIIPEPSPAFTPSAPPVPTTTPEPSTTEPEATATPDATPRPSATPAPAGPCGVGPLALPDPERPVYEGSVNIDPLTRSVVGSLDIGFTPDLPIDELVLRLWPNGPRPSTGGVELTVRNLVVPVPATTRLDHPTLLRIPLDEPWPAGRRIGFSIDFELVVPTELRSRLSGRDDYMRLGTILPLLPWEPGVGWATDPATSLFAESVMSPTADYAIGITVPDGYDVLASGSPDDEGVWRVDAARDFAISVGRFRTLTATAFAPEPVQVTVGVHETMADDPRAYLDKVVDSLEQFSRRFGQYPWPSLTFALTPGLRGGIEFPTHIMQGADTIGRTTSHEVGHMFFYSLVGNNQGREPWLDEGITSYAEFTYEGTPANAWAIPADGIGQATQPMTFWEARAGSYYSSVYSQTGFALQLVGDRDAVDCALARYVADNAHRIARAEDFIAAFEPAFPDIVDRLAVLGVDLRR